MVTQQILIYQKFFFGFWEPHTKKKQNHFLFFKKKKLRHLKKKTRMTTWQTPTYHFLLGEIVDLGVSCLIGKSLWHHARFGFKQLIFAFGVPLVLMHGAQMIFCRQYKQRFRSLVCLGSMQCTTKLQTWLITMEYFRFRSKIGSVISAIGNMFGFSSSKRLLMCVCIDIGYAVFCSPNDNQKFVLKYRENIMLITYDLHCWFLTHKGFDPSIYSILNPALALFPLDSSCDGNDDNIHLLQNVADWAYGELCKPIYEQLRTYLCDDIAKMIMDFADMPHSNLEQKREFCLMECQLLMKNNLHILQHPTH